MNLIIAKRHSHCDDPRHQQTMGSLDSPGQHWTALDSTTVGTEMVLSVKSWTDLGQTWDSSGTTLGQFWDRPGTDLGQLWDRPGTDLGQLWDSSGTALDRLGTVLDRPGTDLWHLVASVAHTKLYFNSCSEV
jgi:hypothetical protein